MKQALIVVNEINRLKEAMNKSKSLYLKNDYRKRINYLINQLNFYCKNKKLNFNEIMEKGGKV